MKIFRLKEKYTNTSKHENYHIQTKGNFFLAEKQLRVTETINSLQKQPWGPHLYAECLKGGSFTVGNTFEADPEMCVFESMSACIDRLKYTFFSSTSFYVNGSFIKCLYIIFNVR